MQSSPSRTPRGLAIYSNRADAVRTRRCAQRDRSPFAGAANRHATSATTPDARNALAGTATPRQILAFGIHSNRAEAIRVNTAQRLGGLQTPVHVRGTLASEVTPRQALQFGAPSNQEEDLFVRGLQTPVPVRGAIAGAGTSQVMRSQVPPESGGHPCSLSAASSWCSDATGARLDRRRCNHRWNVSSRGGSDRPLR